MNALRQQLAPVISPIQQDGTDLTFDLNFDDINDYVGIGQPGPATQQELEVLVKTVVVTALGQAGVAEDAIAELTVSDIVEH